MELNKIYNGDAYELIKQIPDKSIDLIVTDPPYEFCAGGSGTTALACKELGRDFIGCDIDNNYCQIAINRLKELN